MSYEVKTRDYTLAECLALTQEKYKQARPGFRLEEKQYTAAPLPAPPRQIVFDVTHLVSGKTTSGIRRVSLSLARNLHTSKHYGNLPVKFVVFDGRFFQSFELQDITAIEKPFGFSRNKFQHVFAPGDVLLIGEQNYQQNLESYFTAIAAARNQGAQLAYIMHDLQPLHDIAAFGGSEFGTHFLIWWSQVLRFSDKLITISRTVAMDIACYVSITSMIGLTPTRKLPVSHFRLGSNALVEQGKGKKNPDLPDGNNTFYVVGNLFGYKGVLTVLKAMELLWAEGSNAVLVVVGKDRSNLVARAELEAHPEFGKKFIVPGFISDAELSYALQNCGALIVASRMEGFGLPLVEAAALGCPVIARDIEIFQETSGGKAFFFPDGGPEEIATALRQWLKLKRRQQLQYVPRQSLITWQQSAQMLQSILKSNESHFALDVGLTATLNLVTPKKGTDT